MLIRCHNSDEVLAALNENDVGSGDVYLTEIDADRSAPDTKWVGDVSENVSGATVLYIEAESADAVRTIAKECGIEDQS